MYKIYKKIYVEPVRKNGIPHIFDLMGRIVSEKKPHKAILIREFEIHFEAVAAWDLYKLLYKFIERRNGGLAGDYWVATTLEIVTDVDPLGDLYSSDIGDGFFTCDQFYPEQDPAELERIAYEY